MRLIMITGYKGSGKDTVGKIILNSIDGAVRFGFADFLKDIAGLVLSRLGCDNPRAALDDPMMKESPITSMGKPFIFEKHCNITYRRLLQFMGTEMFRNMLDADIWVRPLVALAETKKFEIPCIVVTDTRFLNEYLYPKMSLSPDISIELYAVRREGYGSSDRASETSIVDLTSRPECNFIDNNGTLEELRLQVLDKIVRGDANAQKYEGNSKNQSGSSEEAPRFFPRHRDFS